MSPRKEILADGIELYLGDCRELLPTFGGMVDMTFADPPYLEGDFSNVLPYFLDLSNRTVVTPGKVNSFVWIERVLPTWEYAWLGAQTSLGGRACLHIGFEPVLSWGWPLRPLGTDALNFPIVAKANDTGHPWPKPLALIEKIVSHWSNAGETVLDPFTGSGTTGIAAVNLGRRFLGIEINEKFFDISCARITAALKQKDFFVEKPKPAKQEALL